MKKTAVILVMAALLAGCGQKASDIRPAQGTPAAAAQGEIQQAHDGQDPPIHADGATEEAVQYLNAQMRTAQDPGEADSDVVSRLWYLANAVYNVEDTNFSAGAQPPQDAPQWPDAMRFVDFERLAAHIFSQAGTQQLLSAEIGGGPYIYAKDGVYYHLGAWKTNNVYEEKFSSFEVVDRTDTRMQVNVFYEWQDTQGNDIETRSAPMTLVKENDRWLVEDYRFPEAQYPQA